VEKEGFFHANADLERWDELTLRLARLASVSGRVVAADTGAPVAGATVELLHDHCHACPSNGTSTDAPGRFELAAVPRGRDVTFALAAADCAPQRRALELRADEEHAELDFRLQRGFELSGHVLDFQSGAGIPGAHVGEIVTDASGAFRGRMLPPDGMSA